MKWNTDCVAPHEGDRRTKRKFAFFPVHTSYAGLVESVNYTVWLETYAVLQEYRRVGHIIRNNKAVIQYDWIEITKISLLEEKP